MLSLDGFIKQCRGHIDKGEPFLAYWHAHGFALLRTDKIAWVQYQVKIGGHFRDPDTVRIADTPEQRDAIARAAERRGLRVLGVKTTKRSMKAKAGTITQMRKAIAQMRKDPRTAGTLHVVEFDGVGVSIDGGPELEALL